LSLAHETQPGHISGRFLVSLFSGNLSRFLLHVTFNDFLGTADGPKPIKSHTGFGPLRIDADGPFPSGRTSRLDDGVLDASVFHDRTSYLVLAIQRPAKDFGQININVFNELWRAKGGLVDEAYNTKN
jgi:hypothetical protein